MINELFREIILFFSNWNLVKLKMCFKIRKLIIVVIVMIVGMDEFKSVLSVFLIVFIRLSKVIISNI